MERSLNFSFACGGWLQNYLYGVAKCLQDCGLDEKISCCAGTSAGALTSAGLVLNADFDAIMESVINEYISECRGTWQGPYQVRKYMEDCISKHGNLREFEKANGRLQLNITAIPDILKMQPQLKRICQQHFSSEQELLTALLASSCAVPLAGPPMRDSSGRLVMDGGLTAFQPSIVTKCADKGVTVNVNPIFFSDAQIKPSIYIPVWWLVYPPSPEKYRATYDLGYADAVDWLQKQQQQRESSIFSALDLTPCVKELQRRRADNGDWLKIITGGRRHLESDAASQPQIATKSNNNANRQSRQTASEDAAGFVARFVGYGDPTNGKSSFVSEFLCRTLYPMLLFAVLLLAPICYMLVYCELFMLAITRCMGFGPSHTSLETPKGKGKSKDKRGSTIGQYFTLLCSPVLFWRTWEALVRAVRSPFVVRAHLSPRTQSKRDASSGSMGELLVALQQHSAVYRLSRHILHMPEFNAELPDGN